MEFNAPFIGEVPILLTHPYYISAEEVVEPFRSYS